MDWGWGLSFHHPTTMMKTGLTNVGCDCDAANDHGYDDWYFLGGFLIIPATLSSLIGCAFFVLSCHLECSNWSAYWRWRATTAAAESDQPVAPQAVGEPAPDLTENPVAVPVQHPDDEVAPIPEQAQALHVPWELPSKPQSCCRPQLMSIWGVLPPHTTIELVRRSREEKLAKVADTTSADVAMRVRIGAQLARDFITLHPTAAAALCLLISFWAALRSNYFMLALAGWVLLRGFGTLCAVCWCRPGGRCKGSRAAGDPQPCGTACCVSVTAYFVLAVPIALYSFLFAVDCSSSCALTGWGLDPVFGGNKMTVTMRQLFSAEYYGLYQDFLDQSISEPCVVNGAIDQLLGPGGAVRAALIENHEYWHIGVLSGGAEAMIDVEIQRTKDWIVRRGAVIRSAVATRCASMSSSGDECIRDTSCLTFDCSAAERSMTTCAQGSVQAQCVSSVDACGCTIGHGGWSTSHGCCAASSGTNQRETQACTAERPHGYGVMCDSTHLDACGCEQGAGWSSSNRCCSSSGTSSASELQECREQHYPRPGRLC